MKGRMFMEMEERIKIIMGSMTETENITDVLERAAEDKADEVEIGAGRPREKNSDMFSDATRIENEVVTFLRNSEYPRIVKIICASDAETELYMMAYNYWYATEKDERINDGRWD